MLSRHLQYTKFLKPGENDGTTTTDGHYGHSEDRTPTKFRLNSVILNLTWAFLAHQLADQSTPLTTSYLSVEHR